MILSVLAGALAGTGGYTIYYSEASAYLTNDPAACANCHVMRDHYDGWQKATHHSAATCNDCHVPHELLLKYASKARNGYLHSKGFTFQDFHEPIRIRAGNRATVNDNCISCHSALVSQIASVDANCIHCHSDVGHGPVR